MNVDSIRDGIVIDHIAAGCGMKLYRLLGLENLEAPVAMITNVVFSMLLPSIDPKRTRKRENYGTCLRHAPAQHTPYHTVIPFPSQASHGEFRIPARVCPGVDANQVCRWQT